MVARAVTHLVRTHENYNAAIAAPLRLLSCLARLTATRPEVIGMSALDEAKTVMMTTARDVTAMTIIDRDVTAMTIIDRDATTTIMLDLAATAAPYKTAAMSEMDIARRMWNIAARHDNLLPLLQNPTTYRYTLSSLNYLCGRETLAI